MVWSPNQRIRLTIEKEKLEKYFRSGITWIDPTEETKVEIQFTSNSNTQYKLRVYLPPDYPNSCPKLVVVSPKKLLLNDGKPIPRLSGAFHTLEKKDGFQSICHFYPPEWTAENTLYQVFMKGRLWIEAYEAHLDTGKDMDYYLGHQKFTSDPNNPWIAADESDSSNSSDWNSDLLNSTDDEHYDVDPYWPSHSEARTFEFEQPASVIRFESSAARCASEVYQPPAAPIHPAELTNSQPVFENISVPRRGSGDVSHHSDTVPLANTSTSQRLLHQAPPTALFSADESPVPSTASMVQSSSSSCVNDPHHMSAPLRRSGYSNSELTSNIFESLQHQPSNSESSHNPSPPSSPCSPLSPPSAKDPNESSSLPRRFKPIGSLDVFSAFRERSDNLTMKRRGAPPPVPPKPRRPRS